MSDQVLEISLKYLNGVPPIIYNMNSSADIEVEIKEYYAFVNEIAAVCCETEVKSLNVSLMDIPFTVEKETEVCVFLARGSFEKTDMKHKFMIVKNDVYFEAVEVSAGWRQMKQTPTEKGKANEKKLLIKGATMFPFTASYTSNDQSYNSNDQTASSHQKGGFRLGIRELKRALVRMVSSQPSPDDVRTIAVNVCEAARFYFITHCVADASRSVSGVLKLNNDSENLIVQICLFLIHNWGKIGAVVHRCHEEYKDARFDDDDYWDAPEKFPDKFSRFITKINVLNWVRIVKKPSKERRDCEKEKEKEKIRKENKREMENRQKEKEKEKEKNDASFKIPPCEACANRVKSCACADILEQITINKDDPDVVFRYELDMAVRVSDVIIEVLDVRDPVLTRCVEMEEKVKKYPEKKIILLLNKTDLVPREAAKNWRKHLQQEHLALPFRCNTQELWKSLETSRPVSVIQTGNCMGANPLIKCLESCSTQMKRPITVGILGHPNVGKSSVINTLLQCNVDATYDLVPPEAAKLWLKNLIKELPAFVLKSIESSKPESVVQTKDYLMDMLIKLLENYSLDATQALTRKVRKLTLVDFSGIKFGRNDGSIVLRNRKRIEKHKDPFAPCNEIFKLCSLEVLMKIYKIETPVIATPVDELWHTIATAWGKRKEDGTIDKEAIARIVLHDWNEGRIPFYTMPPDCTMAEVAEFRGVQVEPNVWVDVDFDEDED